MTNRPVAVEDFIHITETGDAAFIIGEAFRRKFDDDVPDVPHHFVAFHRSASGQLTPVSYVHFRPFGDIVLVGGALTDGRAFACMSAEERSAITPERSVYLRTLLHAFDRLGSRYDGFFGYCDDPRAEAVDLQAGFVKTEHPKLLVHWPRELHPVFRRALIAKAAAIGPF